MLKALAKRIVRKEQWEFLSWYRTRFGLLPALCACLRLCLNGRIGRAPNEMTGGYVLLRPGTADQIVYDEVFVAKEYAIDLGEPRFIVDAGAHIGLSSVYFASRYPSAIVVAIEPEPSNFELLLMNARSHPNIKPIRAGLWSKKTQLEIDDSNVATWSFRVSECTSGEGIPAVGVRSLLLDFQVTQIDVLKMDIEGSEVEVLSDENSWIEHVRTLIIELHDRFRPGCSEALDAILDGRQYRKSISGENIVITDLGRNVH